ncbi:MAG: hypothetical protein AUJ72_01685 [Candidatus Omnitrophica bacterium CG1_02_46_14]|nr:MAG: hypothetical protein AUJ72_01685 [Candidatus Omnitrophica bacterium CG1_02_46_14]
MRLYVKAHPKSRKARVLKIDDSHYEVWVNEAPEDGRANRAVLDALAEEIEVRRPSLSVISGLTSKNKVILIS